MRRKKESRKDGEEEIERGKGKRGWRKVKERK